MFINKDSLLPALELWDMMTTQAISKKKKKAKPLQERLKSAENSMLFGTPATGLKRERQGITLIKSCGHEQADQLPIVWDRGV